MTNSFCANRDDRDDVNAAPASLVGAALRYARLGLPVFPCLPNDKRPHPRLAPRGCNSASSDPSVILSWWRKCPDANIGLVAGDTFLILDVDCKDGGDGYGDLTAMESALGELPSTVTAKTPSGGKHFFFKKPDVKIKSAAKIKWQGETTSLDLRFGNAYVLAAPSTIDGKPYTFETPLERTADKSLNIATLPQAWIDSLPKHEPKPATLPVAAAANTSSPPPPAASTPSSLPIDSRSRCRRYVGMMDASIAGQGGHGTCYRAASVIYWDYGLDEREGRPILDEFNGRCRPEWSDAELRHKIADALDPSNHTTRRGWRVTAQEAKKSKTDLATKKRPVLLKASDIKEEKTSWLWDNRFQSNSLNLISGLAGKGKSFFTIYMAACVSKGFKWCDYKECERGSVLMFNGEDSLAQVVIPRLKKHDADLSVIQILDGAVLATKTDENEEAVFSLRDTDVIREAIINTSRNTGVQCRLVIIDPVSNHWGDVKENSNAEVRSVLKPLNKIADELGVCIVLVSHTGKGDKEHAQHRTLGSTAIPAICRTSWILYEEAGTRTLALSKGNCVIDPTTVTFTINDGIVGVTSSDTRKTADEYEAERRQEGGGRHGPAPMRRDEAMSWLEEALSQADKPFVSATELRDRWEDEVGGSVTTLNRAKGSLDVKSSRVTVDGETRYVWHLPSVTVTKDGVAIHAPESPTECPF